MHSRSVPSSGVAAPRYDSTIVQERVIAGTKRMDFPSPLKRSWGFVLLFSLQTGETLALVHDFSMSAIRVGATTGIANRALAKKDSKVVGIFGSGNEARTNLEAICAVRQIELARCTAAPKNTGTVSPRNDRTAERRSAVCHQRRKRSLKVRISLCARQTRASLCLMEAGSSPGNW